jgi:hypothetical protein
MKNRKANTLETNQTKVSLSQKTLKYAFHIPQTDKTETIVSFFRANTLIKCLSHSL